MTLLQMAYCEGFRAGHRFEKDPTPPRMLRVERKIRHRGWQFLHNLIAHPLLAIYRPLGQWFHDFTAARMYGDDIQEYFVDEGGEVNG